MRRMAGPPGRYVIRTQRERRYPRRTASYYDALLDVDFHSMAEVRAAEACARRLRPGGSCAIGGGFYRIKRVK